MDLEAILLSLAERERWQRRVDTLHEDLERLRKRQHALEKVHRRLAKEKARLTNLASSLGSAHPGSQWRGQTRGSDGGPPVLPLR